MNRAAVRAFVVVGFILYVVVLLAAVPILRERIPVAKDHGWAAAYNERGQPVVAWARPAGPAGGRLRAGDVVVAIDGETRFTGQYLPDWLVWRYPPGRVYRADVLRDGKALSVELSVASRATSSGWPAVWALLFCGFGFTAIGVLMGWQRPELPVARLGWAACQLTGLVYINLAMSVSIPQGWTISPLTAALRLIGDWHIWLGWWFVADFLRPGPPYRFWTQIRYGLGVFVALRWICVTLFYLPFLFDSAWTRFLPAWWVRAEQLFNTAFLLAAGISLAGVTIANYRRSADPQARRKIELVAGVTATALLFIAVCTAVASIQGRMLPVWANVAALPVPLAFAYAVLRHRVFDIRIAIQRSAQYLLARQFLRALTLLPLLILAGRAIYEPSAPIGSLFNIAGLGLIVAAALALEFRGRIQTALDRWFAGEMLVREKHLLSLLADINRMDSWERISITAIERLSEIFAFEWVEVDRETARLRLGLKRSGEPLTNEEREMLHLAESQLVSARQRLQQNRAVEDERLRIAREVHDTAGRGFAGISLYMDAARKMIGSGATERATDLIEQAGDLARESLRETRASIAGWREAGAVNLEAKLRSLAESASAAMAIDIDIEPAACDRAKPETQWQLGQVAAEAITNALKHARATRLQIELRTEGAELLLRVRDDGVGFDPGKSRGNGLLGMRERLALIGGSLAIESRAGHGSEVFARAPL